MNLLYYVDVDLIVSGPLKSQRTASHLDGGRWRPLRHCYHTLLMRLKDTISNKTTWPSRLTSGYEIMLWRGVSLTSKRLQQICEACYLRYWPYDAAIRQYPASTASWMLSLRKCFSRARILSQQGNLRLRRRLPHGLRQKGDCAIQGKIHCKFFSPRTVMRENQNQLWSWPATTVIHCFWI